MMQRRSALGVPTQSKCLIARASRLIYTKLQRETHRGFGQKRLGEVVDYFRFYRNLRTAKGVIALLCFADVRISPTGLI